MKKGTVLVSAIRGKDGKKIFRHGEVISEADVAEKTFDSLVKSKHVKLKEDKKVESKDLEGLEDLMKLKLGELQSLCKEKSISFLEGEKKNVLAVRLCENGVSAPKQKQVVNVLELISKYPTDATVESLEDAYSADELRGLVEHFGGDYKANDNKGELAQNILDLRSED